MTVVKSTATNRRFQGADLGGDGQALWLKAKVRAITRAAEFRA